MTPIANVLLTAQSIHIPPIGSQSRVIFDQLIIGCKRKELARLNEAYRGAPLEYLEGKKYGFWLIERYKDEQGDSCLRLDRRHLSGDPVLDEEARKIRRKNRAKLSHKQAKQGIAREPRACAELAAAQKEYFLSLGKAANDADIKN